MAYAVLPARRLRRKKPQGNARSTVKIAIIADPSVRHGRGAPVAGEHQHEGDDADDDTESGQELDTEGHVDEERRQRGQGVDDDRPGRDAQGETAAAPGEDRGDAADDAEDGG